jgi:hypothetical protein
MNETEREKERSGSCGKEALRETVHLLLGKANTRIFGSISVAVPPRSSGKGRWERRQKVKR